MDHPPSLTDLRRILGGDYEARFLGRSTEAQMREGLASRIPSQDCQPHVLPLNHQFLPSGYSHTDTSNAGSRETYFTHFREEM